MHDLIVRGGTVVDGTGEPAVAADVAVDDGRITQVGRIDGDAAEVIDATGKLVTPGFVDVHTHYDGQVTWDPLLTPSSWHGVTTIVMGNCGVGFAPARPDKHDWIIGLMEGVEDIPGAALAAGIRWGWETFPEFLDFLDEQPLALDVGTQVPHGAVRGYVMGERGSRNEPATSDDSAAMAVIVQEAIEAGALGVSTSRTIAHRAIDGEPVPLQPLPLGRGEHRHGAAAGRLREPLLEQHHRLLALATGGDEVVGEPASGGARQAHDDGGGDHPGPDGRPWPAGAGVADTSGEAMHEVLPSEVPSGRRVRP